MLTTAIATTLLLQGGQLPKQVYQIPVVGGQRQIILGPKPDEWMLMRGLYVRDVNARFKATGEDTGGGTVESAIPGGMVEDPIGDFDVVCSPATLFEKPCLQLTTTARWIQKVGRKPREIKWNNIAKQVWWVTPEGKILRHLSSLQTPDGVQTGDCTYGKDSVQRRYTDIRGQTSFGELFPACGMDALNDQFKPMVVDGKIALRDKEFCIANPLTGGIDKYAVRVSGKFSGEYFQSTFRGTTFDIVGPSNTLKTYVSDEGDLVKVDLTSEKYFIIGNLPKSHLDQYGHPIRKSGGGG